MCVAVDIHRTDLDTKSYWLGLYKTNTEYEWYDDNPSTYRKWSANVSQTHRCVCYSEDGFRDEDCGDQHYYTCKKNATSSVQNAGLSTDCLQSSHL